MSSAPPTQGQSPYCSGGAADRILDEAERSMQDALHVIRDLYREPKIVPGGGAFEMEIARKLRDWG